MSPDIRIDTLIGTAVTDRAGEKVGKIGQVYLDNEDGHPTWVTVKTGAFGKEAFVPISLLRHQADGIALPVTVDVVKDSPDVDVEKDLTPLREDVLYRYYGVDRNKAAGGPDDDVRYIRPGEDGDHLG